MIQATLKKEDGKWNLKDILGEEEVGNAYDGYHTFNELYDHRCLIFMALMKINKDQSWYALLHEDGTHWEGWFIAGTKLYGQAITYHLPRKFIEVIKEAGIKMRDRAPKWDGHTPEDVLKRLKNYIIN